ncbi:MAG TPA: DUF4157 domain-containing protein [Pyrinomonadaceae bacterium]|nr:DUF4157 domain-containing protein [Pyrinomonadaceae bacterium]
MSHDEQSQDVPSIVHEVLSSPGQPLDSNTRSLMETRLGHDFSRVPVHQVHLSRSAASGLSIGPADDSFEREAESVAERVGRARAEDGASHAGPARKYDLSQVRVHTDERATESARAVGAAAYTVGRDVVFGAGQYAPSSRRGQALLAHELTHVAQQQQASPALQQRVVQRSIFGSVYNFFSNIFQAIFHMGFSDETLQEYMEVIGKGQPEGNSDSDNKAVAVVNKWKAGEDRKQVKLGEKNYPVPVNIKITLAREVLMPYVSDDDEQSALDLLSLSGDSETAAIIAAIGEQELKKHKRLAGFLVNWHARGGEQIAALKPQQQLKKDQLVEFHQKQQRHVKGLIEEGLKIQPDASKGILDKDNLYHNSCEFIDKGETYMVVLTPTHDTGEREGGPAYFDATVKHPDVGGNYPADSKVKDDARLFFATGYGPGTGGEEIGRKEFSKVFNKETVYLRTPDDDLMNPRAFRNTLVHEVQHEADQHQMGKAHHDFLEDIYLDANWARYQSEFRAYWVQPPVYDTPVPNRVGIDPDFMGTADQPARNEYEVVRQGPKQTGCAADSMKTNFKNKRQEDIFWYLSKISAGFDSYYVCSPRFKKLVDNFALPASGNLVNSVRVRALTEALGKCEKKMDARAPEIEQVKSKAKALDAVDRAFLKNEELSAPFWRLLKARLPDNLIETMTGLIKA